MMAESDYPVVSSNLKKSERGIGLTRLKSGQDGINVIGKGVNENSFVFLESSLPRVACSEEQGQESPNQSVNDSDQISLVNLLFNKEEVAGCGSVGTGKKWVRE